VRLKNKHSHYTQIAQGLGFILWVIAIGLVLNVVVGLLEWRHGYRVPGALHLALVACSAIWYLRFLFN
jgi:hypothetical protein